MWSRERDTPKCGSRKGSGGSSPRAFAALWLALRFAWQHLQTEPRLRAPSEAAGMKAQGTASCPWAHN